MAKLIFNPGEDRPIEALIDDDDEEGYDLVDGIDPNDTEILIEDGGNQYLIVLEGSSFELPPNTIYELSPLTTECEEIADEEEEEEAEAEPTEVAGK